MRRLFIATISIIAFGGCGALEDPEGLTDPVVHDETDTDGKADGPAIRYTILRFFSLPTLKIRTEARRVFRSASSYRSFFASEPPGIDFSQSWLVFYTPGTATPALRDLRGWKASIVSIRTSDTGATLKVTTRLELPATGCGQTPPSTRPFILASFPKPSSAPATTRFYRSDLAHTCDASLEYYDGVGFTAMEGARALAAANQATRARLVERGAGGLQADILVSHRPWPSLSLVAAMGGIGAGTMETLKQLGRTDYSSVSAFRVTDPAAIAAPILGALDDDDSFLEHVFELVSDLTSDTDLFGTTMRAVLAAVKARVSAKAAELLGKSFSSEAAARDAIYTYARSLQRTAVSDYPRGMLNFLTPLTRDQKLARGKAGIIAYWRDTFVYTPEWMSTFDNRTWQDVSARVTADVEALERGSGFGEAAVANGSTFYGGVYGLYTEVTVDDVGKVTRVFVEID